ncbi:DsbA family oxidoreductase [Telluribacter humicola]|uniref:DsbA family oxidoreductase n=1 Tax=Telluribacter humicola TaxID=1720261 RepID=UPI001A9777C8|nr:DsbA family oxidoreductase [Telluribacter humicola]
MFKPITPAITIDIVSDVVCPWCYVGKKRLETALTELPEGSEVNITWHPFQLDPTIPDQGMEREEYFLRKFGNEGKVEQMHAHLTNIGHEVGIDFRFDTITYVLNTISLHKLLHVAGQEGFKDKAEEILFKAYFTDGKDLREASVLAKLFEPFGWNQEKVESILADDAIGYEVKQEIAHYQSMGVSGVPFFIVNNKYGISGAQPSEVFVQALTTVRDEMLEAMSGQACGPEGC